MMDSSNVIVVLAVNAALAALSYAVGAVSLSGVAGGFVVGFLILRFGEWGSFAVLLAFFVLGSAATRLGYSRKAALGVAQEDKGRRGAKHAFANCGAAAAAAVTYHFFSEVHWPLAFLAGAFATAIFDTASSEIGQLYGKHPFLITTMKPVPVGTDGAVSVEGTLAGLAAGALLAGIGLVFSMYSPLGAVFVAIGAFIGTTFESILGAVGTARKQFNNEFLNFLNTVVGGLAAGILVYIFGA
jgi:uncharacterized protein (TIGR00297 family)